MQQFQLKYRKQITNMSEQDLIGQIRSWVKKMHPPKRFKAENIPCLKNSPSFLSKHCEGNTGGYSEYFIRVSRGVYKLK